MLRGVRADNNDMFFCKCKLTTYFPHDPPDKRSRGEREGQEEEEVRRGGARV